MIITALAVISKNGMLTNGEDPKVFRWTSAEDKDHYNNQITAHNLLIMGMHTFEANDANKQLMPDHLRVVLTEHPMSYDAVLGSLEFYNLPLTDLLESLSVRGYTRALLLGGANTYHQFLEADLVDELQLTIEPVEFESGLRLFDKESDLTELYRLVLVSETQLNEAGTVLRTYRKLVSG